MVREVLSLHAEPPRVAAVLALRRGQAMTAVGLSAIAAAIKRRSRRGVVTWVLSYHPDFTLCIWTCDTLDEARWFAFAHQWALVGALGGGGTYRDAFRHITETPVGC